MAGQGRPASQTDAVVDMLALKRAGRAWPRALSRGVARSSSSAGGVDRAALLKALDKKFDGMASVVKNMVEVLDEAARDTAYKGDGPPIKLVSVSY